MGVTSEILIYAPREGKHITGEVIRGIVKFHLDKDTEYKNIALSLIGKGCCEWHDNTSVNTRISDKTVFRGTETIFAQKIYLLNKITDDHITLTAGSYETPFEITIPENIPPSVKTSIGEIKYDLVLKFKKTAILSWNKTFKKRIQIHPKVDSSLSPEPVVATLDKTLFKLFSSKKHEINLEAVLDKGYLIPGRERNITFKVNNKTGVIFSVKTELISKTKYTAEYEKLSKSKVIHSCTVETPEIPDNSESTMVNIIPVAPKICTVRHSDVIKREYKLKVTLKLPLPHVKSSVEIPVFVGENPVRYAVINCEKSGEAFDEPKDDPPSYWEAMYEDK